MNVTITQPAGGHPIGTTITVIDSVGERLITRGVATEAVTEGSKRTRRGKAVATKADMKDEETASETDKADEEGGGGSPSPL